MTRALRLVFIFFWCVRGDERGKGLRPAAGDGVIRFIGGWGAQMKYWVNVAGSDWARRLKPLMRSLIRAARLLCFVVEQPSYLLESTITSLLSPTGSIAWGADRDECYRRKGRVCGRTVRLEYRHRRCYARLPEPGYPCHISAPLNCAHGSIKAALTKGHVGQ